MAKKKIKDITKKEELPDKELKKVTGGTIAPKPTPSPTPKPTPTPICICSTKCALPGWVFGSASRDVEK